MLTKDSYGAMIPLQYDPYSNFMTSTTPVGLYARQRWLGQGGDTKWQISFDGAVTFLIKDQLPDGSWGGSFLRTAHHLFGLHLTVRYPTSDIHRALDWFFERAKGAYEKEWSVPIAGHLDGLPFVPGDRRLLCVAMALFMTVVFGRGSTSKTLALYEKLSQEVLRNGAGQNDCGDMNNILRAFVVHPVYAVSDATALMVERLSGLQDSSGTWHEPVPLYQTVNALAHLSSRQAERQLERAFEALARTQNIDGTWGETGKEWKTFLVVHAMRSKKVLT